MRTGIFDLFKIGIGPSSSHTVGPMRAARSFVARLAEPNILGDVARIQVELFGSLALTGLGHGTDKAILLGLSGEQPETVDPLGIDSLLEGIRAQKRLELLGSYSVTFDEPRDLIFHNDAVL